MQENDLAVHTSRQNLGLNVVRNIANRPVVAPKVVALPVAHSIYYTLYAVQIEDRLKRQ